MRFNGNSWLTEYHLIKTADDPAIIPLNKGGYRQKSQQNKKGEQTPFCLTKHLSDPKSAKRVTFGSALKFSAFHDVFPNGLEYS